MATNSILPFGTTASNELSQSAYAAEPQRLTGNQPGVARSQLVNKALHQVSAVTAGVGQYLADQQATNVDDTLTPAAISAMFGNAVQGRLLAIRFFNTPGAVAYTPTTGTKRVDILGVGAGGGGGGGTATGSGQCAVGSGGGGGGWFRKILSSGFSGATITIGAGGTVGIGAAGGTGGSTSFGAVATANGGTGGSLGTAQANTTVQPSGGAGAGSASGGDVNGAGGVGGYALYGPTNLSGAGGFSVLGGGPSGLVGTVSGVNATTPGAGGGGGAVGSSSGGGVNGGLGAAGAMIIVEYQ